MKPPYKYVTRDSDEKLFRVVNEEIPTTEFSTGHHFPGSLHFKLVGVQSPHDVVIISRTRLAWNFRAAKLSPGALLALDKIFLPDGPTLLKLKPRT